MVLAVLSPDNSTNLFPLWLFYLFTFLLFYLFINLFPLKEPISFIERDKALPPTETVPYACKGLSLSCMFPIALGHGDYLFVLHCKGTNFSARYQISA